MVLNPAPNIPVKRTPKEQKISAIRHDGYGIRDISFQLSLIVFGIKYFLESNEIQDSEHKIYEHYVSDFNRKLKPTLLNLAINLRSVDDEIKSNPELFETLQKHYRHKRIAFSLIDGTELSLRNVCNKIIHSHASHWNSDESQWTLKAQNLLAPLHEHDILIIEGSYQGGPWVIGIDMVALAEQFYEYAEIACERCGI